MRTNVGSESNAPIGADDEWTIVARFDDVVRRRPDTVAVDASEGSVSYAELAAASRRLAAHFREVAGVRRGDHVAVLLEPGIDLIVCVLAALRCGAAYIPLDTQSPAERNRLIVADSRPRAIVGDLDVPGTTLRVPASVVRNAVAAATPAPADQPEGPLPGDVCYVIYTSGTTGTPKGVPITHRNVRALFRATRDLFEFDADDVWLLYHSIAFDFSVWEVWGPLIHGGRLVIPDHWSKLDPAACAALILRTGVTVLNQTPTAFAVLSKALALRVDARPGALRYVIFGGERLAVPALRPWVDRFGLEEPRLVNMYGLTEATVHTTFHLIGIADLALEDSVIGRPLPGFTARVIDEKGQPARRGELVVGGPQVAAGYLERPDLTHAKFGPDPLGSLTDAVFYRTGDWVEERDDMLVYLGRADRQVKIRGHRIELGEVEAAARAVPGIADVAIFVIGETGAQAIACAYTSRSGAPIPARTLRAEFRWRIPQYMLPASFKWLANLPATTNGKVNIQALREEMESKK